MTIRTRLTLWYAVVLTVSLLVIGFGTYTEIDEQLRHDHRRAADEHAFAETGELLLQVGLPAIALGLLGGWWLTRRALAPVTALTKAVEKIHDRNLAEQLARTGNGDELDRLTEVFNAMTARLDGSFQRIREFTLHASHELKTPLTVLHGELETELGEENLPAPQRERLASQLDEIQRLAKIVDGLTLLTKADAGQIALNFEPLALDEIVRDVFADAQILAKSAGLSVNLTDCDALTIRGDKHRLRQLLLNLADNAIKYNQPHGRVTMRLRHTNGFAEFEITNTGAGIPPEILPRVFDRFFRGTPAHQALGTPVSRPASLENAGHERTDQEIGAPPVDGCGLGLSIAQWIVSAHGGKIQIASVPLQSTIVTVQLPRA